MLTLRGNFFLTVITMKIHTSLTVAASFVLASFTALASDDLDITDTTCTVGHINEVAQKQGLEKARALTQSCIAEGYQDLEAQMKEAGSTVMEHYEAAKDFIGQKTEEYSEKAENIKKELMR